jgi:hypothetical protein
VFGSCAAPARTQPSPVGRSSGDACYDHTMESPLLQWDYRTDPLSPLSCSYSIRTGVYVHGLFMEGARFDRKDMSVAESTPGALFDSMPCIWFKPGLMASDDDAAKAGTYACPLYKTSKRAGAEKGLDFVAYHQSCRVQACMVVYSRKLSSTRPPSAQVRERDWTWW